MLGSSRRVEGRDRRGAFSLCFSAPQNIKMVLQMVLRMENPPSPTRSNLNWVQSMVSARRFSPKGWGQSASASLASRPQSQGAIY